MWYRRIQEGSLILQGWYKTLQEVSRGTVGMVLEATGGSQGLRDGINVNKRGLRDSGGGLRGYVKFPWHYQRGIRGLWRGICNYSGGIRGYGK